MRQYYWNYTAMVALLSTPVSAQARIGTIGALSDPSRGTRVSIEAIPATGIHQARVLITVFNPAEPTTVSLSMTRIAELVELSDSVLALPVQPGSKELLFIPIYGFPFDSGSNLITARVVTEQRDLMQVQVNAVGASAIVILSRNAAEGFVAALHQIVAHRAVAGDSSLRRVRTRRPLPHVPLDATPR